MVQSYLDTDWFKVKMQVKFAVSASGFETVNMKTRHFYETVLRHSIPGDEMSTFCFLSTLL